MRKYRKESVAERKRSTKYVCKDEGATATSKGNKNERKKERGVKT